MTPHLEARYLDIVCRIRAEEPRNLNEVATLQNWEQGWRKPEGPAQALLKIAAKNPEVVAEALGR